MERKEENLMKRSGPNSTEARGVPRGRQQPETALAKEQTISANRDEPQNKTAPTRQELVAELTGNLERFVLSDTVFNQLRFFKEALSLVYPYLAKERRRKKRSKQFQWLLANVFRPQSPVDSSILANFRDQILRARRVLKGDALPPDTGERSLRYLKNLMAIRKEPRYWREYRAYCDGKPVSEILREFHPGYDQLHSWEREKYFRKVYNGIQRLVRNMVGRH